MTIHSFGAASAVLCAIALSGCGGPSIRYTKTEITYDKFPLSRSLDDKTFAIKSEGPVPGAESLAVHGMERSSGPADLEIHVVASAPQIAEPKYRTTVKTNSNTTITRASDGKTADMGMPDVYRAMGYTEPQCSHARVTAIHFSSTGYSFPCTMKAVHKSGQSLLQENLGEGGVLEVGKMPGALSWNVEIGNNRSSSRDGVYSDAYPLWGAEWGPQRALEQAAAKISAEYNSGKSSASLEMLKSHTAQQMEMEKNRVAQTMANKLEAVLEHHFGAGQRQVIVQFGDFEQDPGFQAVVEGFQRMRSEKDPAKKAGMGASLVAELEKIKARPDLEVRPRAMIEYSTAVVWLAAGELAKSKDAAVAAGRTNDSEKDGMFSSSGAKLSGYIRELIAHLDDRMARAQRHQR